MKQDKDQTVAHQAGVGDNVADGVRTAGHVKVATVTSDEAFSLLRKIALGQSIPRLKNHCQFWTDATVELFVDGWRLVVFTDSTRSSHLDSITSPDGRRGQFNDWRSDVQFSQQPEDRLGREDSEAVDRMFQAFKLAR
jgi:hypothetical protein